MKYREIYDVLEKQQIDVPGFRFSDYSGWRSPWQSYMTLQRPLWIVAEDPASSRRLWITQDGRDLSITAGKMDRAGTAQLWPLNCAVCLTAMRPNCIKGPVGNAPRSVESSKKTEAF